MILIVRDNYDLQVVHNYPYNRFLFIEIGYFGQVIWLVGIYAPNQATQHIALWGSLLQTLFVGQLRLLMGDFNMCVDASHSTSQHSIMDDLEQTTWVSLVMEVLKLDGGRGCMGNYSGFILQFAQMDIQ